MTVSSKKKLCKYVGHMRITLMRNDIIFGCSMHKDTLHDWERIFSAAAHLQRIIPDAVLVGGTASALYAGHRLSVDADHVIKDLRSRFDAVLI